MADFITTLLCVSGPAESLFTFRQQHLPTDKLDFNSVLPMPPELKIESSSATETGHAALYGDWQSVAGYWMFKEPAATFGYPFPLASREQVIAALRSFDCPDIYLGPAAQYHANLQAYGHGDWHGWCREHWGTKWNADETVIHADTDVIRIKFVTAGNYPKPVMKKLSLDFPGLAFHVRHIDDHERSARDFVLIRGKETTKLKRPPKEIRKECDDFGQQ